MARALGDGSEDGTRTLMYPSCVSKFFRPFEHLENEAIRPDQF